MADALSSFLGGFTGSTIGKASVQLYVDNKKYNADLAASEAKLKGASSTMSKFAQVGAFAFAAVGLAAIKFGVDAVAAAKEHEMALSQLETQIGKNTTGLEENASALQRVSGFSDEAILNADTILSRYELTTAQLKQLNPLLLDYARASGITAEQASMNLGKALLGNARAMKAVGVEFVTTGNTTKDLNTLMGLLEQKVGGVSDAFAQTSEGKAAILNEQFDEFKETIGLSLIPMIEQLQDTLIDLGPALGVVSKFITAALADIRFMVASVVDGIFSLAQVVDTILGPLYSFDGATDHAAKTLEELIHPAAEASRALETQALSYDNAAAHAEEYAGSMGGARVATMKFAHMTGDELTTWLENTKETFGGADTVWDKFADNRKVNVRDIIHSFQQQNRALKNYEENVRNLKAKGLTDEALASLGNMGLEGKRILEGLADATKTEIGKVNEVFGENVERSGGVAKSLIAVGAAVKDLNGARANAEVNVHYTYTGFDGSMPGMTGGR